MKRKHKGSILKKIFIDNKGLVWLLVLVIGAVAVACAVRVDLGYGGGNEFISWKRWPEVRYRLWQASEMVCNIVIAYSTMLVAVVIFYYSVTENKRLGVPYRRLIAYTLGSLTIPILFIVILLLTVLMVGFYHIPWKHTMYVCAVYILALQFFVIIEIMRSTSYDCGKRAICREERKNYDKWIVLQGSYSADLGYCTGHLEQAIHSGESIQDKKELLDEFLRIPFQQRKGNPFCKKSRQEALAGKKEQEKIYLFYFGNISSAFQNLDGEEKAIERNELYLCIGGFLKELYGYLKSVDDLEQDSKNIVYHMTLSGIMNGMVYSNIKDNAVFCDYILEECVPDGMRVLQLRLYGLFQEVMSMFDEKRWKLPRTKKLAELKPIKSDKEILICADFWNVWVKMFKLPVESKIEHFRAAMQTMTGYGIGSQTMLEMLFSMGKKE